MATWSGKVGSVGATECALVNIRGIKVKGGRLLDVRTSF